jgi:hypothetical protein
MVQVGQSSRRTAISSNATEARRLASPPNRPVRTAAACRPLAAEKAAGALYFPGNSAACASAMGASPTQDYLRRFIPTQRWSLPMQPIQLFALASRSKPIGSRSARSVVARQHRQRQHAPGSSAKDVTPFQAVLEDHRHPHGPRRSPATSRRKPVRPGHRVSDNQLNPPKRSACRSPATLSALAEELIQDGPEIKRHFELNARAS